MAPRLSYQSLLALRAIQESEVAGADIIRSTGIVSGTLYPMLARLEACGWLKSRWEKEDPKVLGRPRRRLYSMTPLGKRAAAGAFSAIA